MSFWLAAIALNEYGSFTVTSFIIDFLNAYPKICSHGKLRTFDCQYISSIKTLLFYSFMRVF